MLPRHSKIGLASIFLLHPSWSNSVVLFDHLHIYHQILHCNLKRISITVLGLLRSINVIPACFFYHLISQLVASASRHKTQFLDCSSTNHSLMSFIRLFYDTSYHANFHDSEPTNSSLCLILFTITVDQL